MSYTGINEIRRITVGQNLPIRGTSQRGWKFKVTQNISISALRIMTGTTDGHNIVTIYNFETGQLMAKTIVDSTTKLWNETELTQPVVLTPGDYVVSAFVWDRGVNVYANLYQEGPNDFSKASFNKTGIEFICPVTEDFPIQGYDIYPVEGSWTGIIDQHIYQQFESTDFDKVLAKVPIRMPKDLSEYLSGIPDFVYDIVIVPPPTSTPISSTPTSSTPV